VCGGKDFARTSYRHFRAVNLFSDPFLIDKVLHLDELWVTNVVYYFGGKVIIGSAIDDTGDEGTVKKGEDLGALSPFPVARAPSVYKYTTATAATALTG